MFTMHRAPDEPAEFAYRYEHDHRPIDTVPKATATHLYTLVDKVLALGRAPQRPPAALEDATEHPQQAAADVQAAQSEPVEPSSVVDQGGAAASGPAVFDQPPPLTYTHVLSRKVLRQLTTLNSRVQGIEALMLSTVANGQVTHSAPAPQQGAPPVTLPAPTAAAQSLAGSVAQPTPSASDPPGAARVHPTTTHRDAEHAAAPTLGSPAAALPAVGPLLAAAMLPPVAAIALAAAPVPKTYALTLTINDETVTFDARLVPDPPLRHFSKQLDELFVHWYSSTLLMICGRGIPVRHWATVYKTLKRMKLRPKAWDAIKVEWGNWKFVVDVMEQKGSPYAVDAAAAKAFFGNDLDHPDAKNVFRYVKTGQSMLITKNAAIAEKWRNLLKSDPALHQRYLEGHR
ncbi:hypothetical protein PsYK624_052710 [Phanerochaete sordida]|uniref:Uncharacterized protein n=1 Tax=Phanerochaete sordida TaxID=48140 RepID=A0A9P3G6L7_9APHY|nr:hypothetical protein PsYK624_052710 [Phanerochaete sordida]